jgi:UDP-2-acetamido-2,6-beta-L-arabino-hexul-4-ose reductase
VDERGSFTEFLNPKTGVRYLSTLQAGYHEGSTLASYQEREVSGVSGKGVIRFRKIDEEKVHEYYVSGEKLEWLIFCGL